MRFANISRLRGAVSRFLPDLLRAISLFQAKSRVNSTHRGSKRADRRFSYGPWSYCGSEETPIDEGGFRSLWAGCHTRRFRQLRRVVSRGLQRSHPGVAEAAADRAGTVQSQRAPIPPRCTPDCFRHTPGNFPRAPGDRTIVTVRNFQGLETQRLAVPKVGKSLPVSPARPAGETSVLARRAAPPGSRSYSSNRNAAPSVTVSRP